MKSSSEDHFRYLAMFLACWVKSDFSLCSSILNAFDSLLMEIKRVTTGVVTAPDVIWHPF